MTDQLSALSVKSVAGFSGCKYSMLSIRGRDLVNHQSRAYARFNVLKCSLQPSIIKPVEFMASA